MANGQMTNYIMPTSMDLPPIRVDFVEFPYPHGPGGAKGIGELPMDGPAPAIFNAVRNATGLDVTRLPLTPEDLDGLRCRARARCSDEHAGFRSRVDRISFTVNGEAVERRGPSDGPRCSTSCASSCT